MLGRCRGVVHLAAEAWMALLLQAPGLLALQKQRALCWQRAVLPGCWRWQQVPRWRQLRGVQAGLAGRHRPDPLLAWEEAWAW